MASFAMRGRLLPLVGLLAFSLLASLASGVGLDYYTRENCKNAGLLPNWLDKDYRPATHFERHFQTPLNLDLVASAHSGNESGFEQVTADWGCPFKGCYGESCKTQGFYGVGAKDPKGGGCGHGPIKVFEDLTCAIKLGLNGDKDAFSKFCEGDSEGMFECLAFFANVITETGAFAETEERDPRPYCWNRKPGNTECCPAADHKPCLEDSADELSEDKYPKPNERWLTDKEVDKKCCSYHGRGFLQVSYEPNYRALSQSMVGDEKVLWHYPYKLDSDGVAGWTAALWFWFNKHPAQVVPVKPDAIETTPDEDKKLWYTSPRDRVLDWKNGGGLPGAINVINGGECSGEMTTQRAFSRVSYFFALAHRMKAKPPPGNQAPLYPLPGTRECDQLPFCQLQFHNDKSECKVFRNNLDCTDTPYITNASTPLGFWRKTMKLTKPDGATPVCRGGKVRGNTPMAWMHFQEGLNPIPEWWKMIDITEQNICDYVVHYFTAPDGRVLEGQVEVCKAVGQQKPCATLAMYMGHPLPAKGWETGEMGDYKGGAYIGRVGPGLVMAMNGKWGFGDTKDKLCFLYGASQCHWNVAQGCSAGAVRDVHNCRILPPGVSKAAISWTDIEPSSQEEVLKPGEFPKQMREVLSHWNRENCPQPTGRTVLEQIFTHGELDLDLLFSMQYSQNDGFDNVYFDKENQTGVNVNLAGKGTWGPRIVWKEMLCAFNLGLPSDPDYFAKSFGLQRDVSSAASVPFPLSEDERRFAMMEFFAFAANVIKETGAVGQAEEQDPRCYCNYQGGGKNPCCPNDWGNNPPCYVSTEIGLPILPEELKRGTGQQAKCCSYHGRGYLQSSYEKNYGDMGEKMLYAPQRGVSRDLARKLAVNFPQYIDSMGIMGWSAAFMFWLEEHPCQYCGGRNTTTLDWNAPGESPHKSMVKYDVPGEGLGKTFNIINGQECEAAFTKEANVSLLGGAMRLSFFYNAAYRFQAKPPGEEMIFPLPGTKECLQSKWCKGTFTETGRIWPGTNYRKHDGGCWALTPQPDGNGKEYWTYCRPQVVKGATRFGARLETVSFTMRRPDPARCEMLHDFSCGVKLVDPSNPPSMLSDPELKAYTSGKKATEDYDVPGFQTYLGWSPSDICPYVEDSVPGDNSPAAPQDCFFWCNEESGARGNCRLRDDKTCEINGMGVLFMHCANRIFKDYLKDQAPQCFIPLGDDGLLKNKGNPPVHTTPAPVNCVGCRDCISGKEGDGQANEDCKNLCYLGHNSNVWPCHMEGYCKCRDGAGIETEAPFDGNPCTDCQSCVSDSGKSWETENCKKCTTVPKDRAEWPCSIKGYCRCVGAPTPTDAPVLPVPPPKVNKKRTPPVPPTA